MKVLLHSHVAAPSLLGRYRFAQQRLRDAGIDSNIRTGVAPGIGADPGDVLVSHNFIPPAERERLANRCFGGKRMTRPEQLTLLASLGFPTMEWTTVNSRADALALCDSWGVGYLILKRSFTGGGAGFHVLTKNQPRYATWDFEKDVICREVNPDDGSVYKAELFGGKLMLGFILKKQPLKNRLLANDECPNGVRQLATYRNDKERPDARHRGVWEFSRSEKTALERLSVALTQHDFGYVSVDMMRRPGGQLVAIEINTANVATWWSETFPLVRERFAASLLSLVQRI
jgi:hypothetical protein